MKTLRRETIALALTWDGARVPIRELPPKARAFLGNQAIPSSSQTAKLFATSSVSEIRVCWIPQLRGGDNVLTQSFPAEKRIAFRPVRTTRFGDLLGVVYRR